MKTQDTPVHPRLWHREFWLMAVANLLLTFSVYMLIPTMPTWLLAEGFTLKQTGLAMGAFAVGLFLPGPLCSFLVERYRRNWVCMLAIVTLVVCLSLMATLGYVGVRRVVLLRVLLGAAFGLAQMVLCSTLIIDTSESNQRTEANYSAAWFGRFALSIGPLVGLIVYARLGFEGVLMAAVVAAVVSVLLVLMVHFPFRTPADRLRVLSLDRFFLPMGFPLFAALAASTLVVGLLMAAPLSRMFYAMMMVGFLLALLAKHFVFRDAELKSEVVTGQGLMAVALLLMLTRGQMPVVAYVAPLFIGFGIGTVGSRYLLFFIKLSRHCQRGTSQSTFMLAWESGIALGIGIGYYFLWGNLTSLLKVALVVCVAMLVVYVVWLHKWFMAHKNR